MISGGGGELSVKAAGVNLYAKNYRLILGFLGFLGFFIAGMILLYYETIYKTVEDSLKSK